MHPQQESSAGIGHDSAFPAPATIRNPPDSLEPFIQACGGQQTISLAVARGHSRNFSDSYIFSQPFVLIGRSIDSDLVLPEQSVCFRHIYLQLHGGRWSFFNLAAMSGGAINTGNTIAGAFETGSELHVGPFTIKCVKQGRPHGTGAAEPKPRMGSVSLALDLIDGRSSSQRTWLRTISEPVTLIGAARQCDVWLPEGGLSKVHASLVLTENAAWVVDLLGRNGVSVADRAVYWKQLYNGAILQIGRCRFRVRLYASPDPKAICRMNRVGPEILKEPDPTPASGRTVSVESVMSLIQRLNVVQRQFSECCQLQLQTITQILAHQGRGQQTPVHGEPRMPAFGTFPNRGCNASPSRK